jgi:hypothetical protein
MIADAPAAEVGCATSALRARSAGYVPASFFTTGAIASNPSPENTM